MYCTVMLCISLIPFENPGWRTDTFKTYTACHNVKGMLYTKLVLSRGEYNGRLKKPETRIGNRNGKGSENQNWNRKQRRNRNDNVKGNRYKNKDIINLDIFWFLFNSNSIYTKNKKTRLGSYDWHVWLLTCR